MTRDGELLQKIQTGTASLEEARELTLLLKGKGGRIPIELREARLRLALAQDPKNRRLRAKLGRMLEKQGKNLPPDGETGAEIEAAEMSVPAADGGKMMLKGDNVTLITMPKSGSLFLHQRLAKALGLTEKVAYVCANSGFPYDAIVRDKLAAFSRRKGKHVITEHAPPSLVNLRLLKKYSGKVVIHIRDPRAALLSWVHHIENNLKSREDLDNVELEYPIDYQDRDFESKLDWNIRNMFPLYVEWLSRWIDAFDSKALGIAYLMTTHDELSRDAVSVLVRICQFYGIEEADTEQFDVSVQVGKDHYRKGSPDEFFEVFTAEQITFCNELMPKTWNERFGWRR